MRCYLCDSPHHLARDCHKHKTESQGRTSQKVTQVPKGAKMISTRHYTSKQKQSSCVEVKVEGIPVTGLIDTGSDITIIRGDLIYHIFGITGLDESRLKPADLKACTYDQKPITLDGQIDLHISFGEKVICTTAYVKLVAPDQLLLSETVCCQLGIVSYHPSVQSMQGCYTTVTSRPSVNISDCESDTLSVGDKEVPKLITPTLQSGTEVMEKPVTSTGNKEENLTEKQPPSDTNQVTEDKTDVKGKVPQRSGNVMSQVRLIKAVRLPASYAAVVPVQVAEVKGTILLEPSKSLNQALQVEESLLEVKEDGSTTVVIVNNSNSSCQLKKGTKLGQAIGADVIDHAQQESLPSQQSSSTDTSLSAESEVIQQLPEGLNVFGVSVPTSTSSEHVKWR